ncbi:hypothetical protein V6C42_16095 [Pseudoclostridium thermosuccinogenes]|jgi:hypothetical protein|nr:hypothetical protein [Pseudoclostridium thermosuccinogenes]
MRTKRLDKFRKYRYRKYRKFFLFVVVIPFASVFVGYLLTSLIILPVMSK